MHDDRLRELVQTRARRPEAIAEAAAARRRPRSVLDGDGRIMVIAADHPARGSLGAGPQPLAMADRKDLLDRLCLALSRPGMTGVLGTPDIIEDLLLLGALDDKVVFGSMNRGGLAGASWEIDDRFTAYDAASLAAMGYDGGKMLTRIDLQDPATAATVEACSRAVSELAERRLVAMVEPFMARRVDGRLRTELTTEAAIRASAISAGLGTTSAYTWLKVPVVDDMERVAGATTLPTVLLGGEVKEDQDAAFDAWRTALAVPNVIGLVIGRSLLYPPDDDVSAAVDAAVSLLPTPSVRS
ncbi:MAG: hypothetical protein QOH72_2551 [Solirubrobacteraceae bacterium]|jgi:hypothetical protein|nr:hypothetical protein [Solirubrobacteraceae bacterium]